MTPRALPKVGKGWRLLKAGDKVPANSSVEIWCGHEEEWRPSSAWSMDSKDDIFDAWLGNLYRIRITKSVPPDPTDPQKFLSLRRAVLKAKTLKEAKAAAMQAGGG